jgi:hypothetical protein
LRRHAQQALDELETTWRGRLDRMADLLAQCTASGEGTPPNHPATVEKHHLTQGSKSTFHGGSGRRYVDGQLAGYGRRPADLAMEGQRTALGPIDALLPG